MHPALDSVNDETMKIVSQFDVKSTSYPYFLLEMNIMKNCLSLQISTLLFWKREDNCITIKK